MQLQCSSCEAMHDGNRCSKGCLLEVATAVLRMELYVNADDGTGEVRVERI